VLPAFGIRVRRLVTRFSFEKQILSVSYDSEWIVKVVVKVLP
jgi:hypothetical protein